MSLHALLSETEGYAIPFLFGGLLVAAIKFLSIHTSPALAATLGAFPTGIIATLMLSEEQVPKYMTPYTISGLIISMSSIVYIYLLHNTEINVRVGFYIVFALWVVLVALKMLIFRKITK